MNYHLSLHLILTERLSAYTKQLFLYVSATTCRPHGLLSNLVLLKVCNVLLNISKRSLAWYARFGSYYVKCVKRFNFKNKTVISIRIRKDFTYVIWCEKSYPSRYADIPSVKPRDLRRVALELEMSYNHHNNYTWAYLDRNPVWHTHGKTLCLHKYVPGTLCVNLINNTCMHIILQGISLHLRSYDAWPKTTIFLISRKNLVHIVLYFNSTLRGYCISYPKKFQN